jgi:hypothetical protein
VIELKLSLLDAGRIDTASPGSWSISLDGERVLGGLADGPVDAADLVRQRSAQELRDQIDDGRLAARPPGRAPAARALTAQQQLQRRPGMPVRRS